MTAFPDPAARSADEAAFLRAILADLPNDLPRLVYADWLDDREDARAAVLRQTLHFARAGGKRPKAGKPAPWLALTGVQLLAELRGVSLWERAETLLQLARPVVSLVPKKASDKKLPVGASKFNGDPDVPAGFVWPEGDDGPFRFLAQINLADLNGSPAAAELPAGGWLSVFYDDEAFDEDDGGWRYLFTPAGTELTRRPAPSGVGPITCCRLEFREGWSLPSGYDSPVDKELSYKTWTEAETTAYDELTGRLHGGHHLLGYPRPIQGDTLGSKTRRHLLTLDIDDAPEWCFGDMGALYFDITAGEPAKGKLTKPRCEMQCS